jgi:peptidoglycan/xylan/chitin deacetylase (PgdA/CDA1 family)
MVGDAVITRLPFALWPTPAGRLTILIYHRVLSQPDPLRPGESHAALFERQMALLARCFQPMALGDAVRASREGRLPKRACCVTFDDGYADNLTVALPILQRHGIPASVFVATAYLDGGRMFNDAVIDCIGATQDTRLDLRALDLGLLPLGSVAERRTAVSSILNVIRYLPPRERDDRVAGMIKTAGIAPLSRDLMLTTPQLRQLARSGVDIGGHTMSHTVLTTLSDDEAEVEIGGGKRTLEGLLEQPVRHFAYPNGVPVRDYHRGHAELVRRLGFDLAVSTAPGVVNAEHFDAFQLPRYTPWGTSTLALSARLARNARSPGHALA